jgi:glycine cleavage system H protein
MSLHFTKDHEWIAVEDGVGTVGVTDYAQKQLGDVVFVELPEVGGVIDAEGEVGVIESVKAASELYSPVTGEVIETNEVLGEDPALINSSPEDKAWIFKIKLDDPGQLDGLMDAAAYKAFVADLDD